MYWISLNADFSADFPFITYYLINKQNTDPLDFYNEVQCAALRKFDPRDLRYAASHTLDLFNEVATIARPPLEPPGGRPPIPSTGYIVSIFKVFEGDDGLKFEQNWLYWTGECLLPLFSICFQIIQKKVVLFYLILIVSSHVLQARVWCIDICRNRWVWDASRCTNRCRRATRCIYWSASARSCKTICRPRRYFCRRYVHVSAATPDSTDPRCVSDSLPSCWSLRGASFRTASRVLPRKNLSETVSSHF